MARRGPSRNEDDDRARGRDRRSPTTVILRRELGTTPSPIRTPDAPTTHNAPRPARPRAPRSPRAPPSTRPPLLVPCRLPVRAPRRTMDLPNRQSIVEEGPQGPRRPASITPGNHTWNLDTIASVACQLADAQRPNSSLELGKRVWKGGACTYPMQKRRSSERPSSPASGSNRVNGRLTGSASRSLIGGASADASGRGSSGSLRSPGSTGSAGTAGGGASENEELMAEVRGRMFDGRFLDAERGQSSEVVERLGQRVEVFRNNVVAEIAAMSAELTATRRELRALRAMVAGEVPSAGEEESKRGRRRRDNWSAKENADFLRLVREHAGMEEMALRRMLARFFAPRRTHEQCANHLRILRAQGKVPAAVGDAVAYRRVA